MLIKTTGLAYEIPTLWEAATKYSTCYLTEAALLWDAIDFDIGVLALDQEYTRKKGIPDAQPFPWDDSKGIYLTSAYHSIHCLNLVEPQTWPLSHITHRLDPLRSEAMCQADDTPRWASIDQKRESGLGQYRMCRDWSRLESWAREHTACYRYLGGQADYIDQRERFKFCPPGSPYHYPVSGQ